MKKSMKKIFKKMLKKKVLKKNTETVRTLERITNNKL